MQTHAEYETVDRLTALLKRAIYETNSQGYINVSLNVRRGYIGEELDIYWGIYSQDFGSCSGATPEAAIDEVIKTAGKGAKIAKLLALRKEADELEAKINAEHPENE